MTILLIEEILSISDQIIAGSEEEIGKSPEFQGNPGLVNYYFIWPAINLNCFAGFLEINMLGRCSGAQGFLAKFTKRF